MRTTSIVYLLIAAAMTISTLTLSATGLPVVGTHPRVLLTPAIKSQLLARRNANDPRWLKLKAQADLLKSYSILQYKWATRTDEPNNTIFYDYQGEGWYSAAMPLAFAYQMTGDTSYSNKLFALTDEMIRAQSDPDNMPPTGFGPLVPGNYYSTRSLGAILAIAYDWCYDQLGSRKAGILSLMNAYYNEIRDSAYQRNERADGNYFVGHLFAVAMMGYASYGDNPNAQEMIDWARIRFDGTPSALIDTLHRPEDFFAQLFEGGTRPQVAREYNGPNITTAPFKGGFDFQGWAYGNGTYNRIIDYMLAVKSATGEDLIATHVSWLSQILRALKHGLMPNRFEIDPSGDFGSDWGAVISRSLPVRLAYALAGTPDGPGAQSFAYAEIAPTSPYPVDFPDYAYLSVYQPTEWEDFFFTDTTRPSSELMLPPYYSGFAPAYPQGGATNGAIPYFYMRSDWSATATWASIQMGTAFYDDHQHSNAGHLVIKHGNDYLAVDASNWKGATGSIGIVGSSLDEEYGAGATANTLFFDDYGDFMWSDTNDSRYCGGQGFWGKDEVVAAEQNDDYSYIRSDLSTAYNRGGDTTDQGVRRLEYFYRNFAYLRAADVFVVFDQTKARPSTNPRGEYRKHIRWHFPNRPTVNGNTLGMEQGVSRLNMAFLLPASVAVTAVDETQNPDPCDGTVPGCTSYGFNSGTWRVEVRDPNASLTTPFLAVLQPTALADPSMTASNVTSNDGTMIGANISVPGRGRYVMLFNNGDGQTPTPITSVTYTVSGASEARHTLGGMKPGSRYAVTIAESVVTVSENAAGTYVASPAGVLQFGTAVSSVEQADDPASRASLLEANYPNPFDRSTTIGFLLQQPQHVTLTLVDALGRTVRTLVDADLPSGEQRVALSAEGLPNGVYSYVLRGAGFVQTRQCVVMK
jgi:hypothetical protein